MVIVTVLGLVCGAPAKGWGETPRSNNIASVLQAASNRVCGAAHLLGLCAALQPKGTCIAAFCYSLEASAHQRALPSAAQL